MRRLVLWDIDGTLLTTAPHGGEAFADAFEALVGRPPSGGPVPMAGRTDLEIATELLERDGVAAAPERVAAFERELAAALAARAPRLRHDGRAMAGGAEALAALSREEGVVQSLLTGNIEPNARLKLAAFGLDRHLDFEVGAYGSGHRMRPELVTIARRKARRKHGVDFRPEDTVLIGDTPLDVAAARAAGARAVAVATGPHPAGALEAAGATLVLPDLGDTRAVLDAVLG